jgi:hypothetical protein
MSVFFGLLLNIAIVVAAAYQYYLMALLVAQANSLTEKYLRVLAYIAGIITVLGAKALGDSISSVLIRALLSGRPTSIGLLGVAVPAAAGAAMAWYFVRTVRKKGSNIATRVLIFIGVLAVTQFADVYIAAFRAHGVVLGATLAPNIAFVVGLSLYLILTWNPDGTEESGFMNAIKKREDDWEMEKRRRY